MEIQRDIPLLEDILSEYRPVLGGDYSPYKNHVFRVVNFCFLLEPEMGDAAREKTVIAGAFHDLGIWTDDTLDYLSPSVVLAKTYLAGRNLAKWSDEVGLMIDQHHKLRRYQDAAYPLVELFRRADLVDVSLGAVAFGLPAEAVRQVKASFPNLGFHKRLNELGIRELLRNPLRPVPFLKW